MFKLLSNLKVFGGKVGNYINSNSPTILTGMACAGLVTTAIFAVQATPKAIAIIEEEAYLRRKKCEEGQEPDKLTALEVAMLTWKEFTPAIIMGGVTIACIVGANSINTRRNAALAGMYTITEKTLKEYKDKVIETVGEKKEQEIRDEVNKSKVEKNPVDPNKVIFTGKGNTLCLEPITGRYFRSDIESIRKAENRLNHEMLEGSNVASLNDLAYELGLPSTKLGDDIGWHINDGMIAFDFTSALTPDGEPCLVLDHRTEPRCSYLNLF